MQELEGRKEAAMLRIAEANEELEALQRELLCCQAASATAQRELGIRRSQVAEAEERLVSVQAEYAAYSHGRTYTVDEGVWPQAKELQMRELEAALNGREQAVRQLQSEVQRLQRESNELRHLQSEELQSTSMRLQQVCALY